MPADPITPVSESPRQVVQDKRSDAGKVEDSVRSWAREVVIALRALLKRVAAVETQNASLTDKIAGLSAISSVSTSATPALPVVRSSESTTAENTGTGAGVFKEKVGTTLRFRKLKAGANMQVEEDENEIRIGLKLLEFDTSSIAPSGAIQLWAAAIASIPAGWLLCDGAVLNIADYPKLGPLLGATYGGDGVTTFGLPDSRDRFPFGPAAAEEPGATGGTVQHKHGVGTLANSSESAGTPAGTIDNHTAANDTAVTGASTRLTGPTTHTFAGTALGNHTHTLSGKTDVNENLAASTATADVLPPFLKLAFIIKV